MKIRKGLDEIDIDIQECEGIPVVNLSGSFSGEVAYKAFDYIKENLFEKGEYSLIIDMNNLKKFLSRGVAAIIELCTEISNKKGKVVLVCVVETFCTIMEECDMGSLASIVPNLETALKRMRE